LTRYLLDSHAAIWWWTASPRLSDAARDAIRSTDNSVFLSVASVWEIAVKSASGRLPEIENFQADYPGLMKQNAFLRYDVRDDHAIHAAYLGGDHRDPFDRLIAAQALIDDLIVITCDRQIAGFGCKVLW
jgi:PIN domain nuclease of toxin-antitoxin system